MMLVTDAEVIKFYNSAGWKSLRQVKLNANLLCQACQMLGVIMPAIEVHHMLPIQNISSSLFRLDGNKSIERMLNRQNRKGAFNKGMIPSWGFQ